MMLPKPLSLEEIQAHIPSIGPVPEGIHRPFWSVMIPTYNNGKYLRRTLESVLCQAPGPDEMQIEVVDGGSTLDDPEQLVKELGRGRVTLSRLTTNQGPAHTFNTCIQRSYGHWIHILHGDDMVLRGFYEAYRAVISAYPEARTVLGQSVTIDEADRWMGVYGVAPPVGGGILNDFAERQATKQLILFPSVIVSRDAYEQVGGFCTLFKHNTDWDMWFRLGQLAPVASVSHPHALCRFHGESDTSRQKVSAANLRECYFAVTANLARMKGRRRTAEEPPWRSQLANYAESTAWQLDSQNCTEGLYNQARWAWMLEPRIGRLIMVLKSWLKYRLRGKALSQAT